MKKYLRQNENFWVLETEKKFSFPVFRLPGEFSVHILPAVGKQLTEVL